MKVSILRLAALGAIALAGCGNGSTGPTANVPPVENVDNAVVSPASKAPDVTVTTKSGRKVQAAPTGMTVD